LGPGAIAGIVIGVIVVIGLLAFAGWIYIRKKSHAPPISQERNPKKQEASV